MVYGHAYGNTIEKTVEDVSRHLDAKYVAVRAQCAIPGLPTTYGVASNDRSYEPAQKGLPGRARLVVRRNTSGSFQRCSMSSAPLSAMTFICSTTCITG